MFFSLASKAQKVERIAVDLWPEQNRQGETKALKDGMMFVFPADRRNNCGKSVIICPGGGYARYSMNNEGFDWIPFFRGLGFTVAVLKYTLPDGNPDLPLKDAEQAMRVMKSHGGEWGVNPDSVGIMGFSAGGHLASMLTVTEKDDVRPAFAILFYPVISMKEGITHVRSHNELMTAEASAETERRFSSELHVGPKTPPVFIACSNDDHTVKPKNAATFYMAMLDNERNCSLHVYPTGRHGWGFRDSFVYHDQMVSELTRWIMCAMNKQDNKPEAVRKK